MNYSSCNRRRRVATKIDGMKEEDYDMQFQIFKYFHLHS
jgi:hypothetical protein